MLLRLPGITRSHTEWHVTCKLTAVGAGSDTVVTLVQQACVVVNGENMPVPTAHRGGAARIGTLDGRIQREGVPTCTSQQRQTGVGRDALSLIVGCFWCLGSTPTDTGAKTLGRRTGTGHTASCQISAAHLVN